VYGPHSNEILIHDALHPYPPGLLYHSSVSLPIPGTTSLAHLTENLAAQNIRLDPDEVTAITGLVPEQSP
jgi:hypothetical protein